MWDKINMKTGKYMSAPSKANIGNPGNPERVMVNHRHGTEPCV